MVRTFRRECPQCSQQVMWPETPTYPFCSERCRLIDLGVWATEGYRIAGEPFEDIEEGLDVVGGRLDNQQVQGFHGVHDGVSYLPDPPCEYSHGPSVTSQ